MRNKRLESDKDRFGDDEEYENLKITQGICYFLRFCDKVIV